MDKKDNNITAFNYVPKILEIQGKDTKIFSFICVEKTLYVGLNNGSICMYNLQLQDNNDIPVVPFSDKPTIQKYMGEGKKISINQMSYAKKIHCLIVRCSNGVLMALNSKTLTRLPSILNSKNIEAFYLNESSVTLKLCAATKKRLQLYQYTNESFSLLQELVIPDHALTLSWESEDIWVGFKKDYSIINSKSGKVTNIPIAVDKTRPYIHFSEHEVMLSVNTHNLVVSNFLGEIDSSPPISLNNFPLSIVQTRYYLVVMLPDRVQIFSSNNHRLVQTILLNKNVSLSSDYQYVFVCNETQVGVLVSTPIEQQVNELISMIHIEEAIALLMKTQPDQQTLSNVHCQAGWVLLRDLQIVEAFNHFSSSGIDPRELINLFPPLILPSLPYNSVDPGNPKMNISELIAKKTQKKHDFLDNFKFNDEKDRFDFSQWGDIEYLSLAQYCLAEFLWKRKTSPLPNYEIKQPEVKLAVDTALLMLNVMHYISDSGQKLLLMKRKNIPSYEPKDFNNFELSYNLEQLLIPENSCFFKDSEEFLSNSRLYHSLSLLYYSKEMYTKALDIWAKLGRGETDYKDSSHDGITDTINCLCQIDSLDLIFRYSEWVLLSVPKEGLKIFYIQRSNPLPKDKIINYLDRISEHSQDFDFVEHFLEHIIFIENSLDPYFHNQLALLYLKKCLSLVIDQDITFEISPPSPTVPLTHHTRSTAILHSSPNIPINEPGPLGTIRTKFYNFLKNSEYYNPSEILEKIKDTNLYPELIIIYRRKGLHKEVLKVYIDFLQDHQGAVQYCEEFPTSSPIRQEIILHLLQIYCESDSAFSPFAWDLLHRFSSDIDPIAVIKNLPKNVPLNKLYSYIHKIFSQYYHQHRYYQVVSNLNKFVNFQSRISLSQAKIQGISISRQTKCDVCKKPIDKYIFLYNTTTNQIVHYKCSSKKPFIEESKKI